MSPTAKLKHFWRAVKELFSDYAGHSTIHGVSYMDERNRPWLEKLWWIVVFGISVLGCGKMIFDAWNITPIIISFTDKPTSLEQIPFPGVTLCPSTFSQLLDLPEIIKRYYEDGEKTILDTLSDEEKIRLAVKMEFCASGYFFDAFENYTNCNVCLRVMNEIKIPFEDMFVECKFRNQVINCKESFQEMVVGTNVGKALCYTFNGLNIYRNFNFRKDITDEWNIDDGYKSTSSLDAYPRRALRSGPKFGLSILMRSKHEHYDNYCTRISATRLEYRMPYESPQFITNYFNARMQFSATYILKPNMIVTSDELRAYSVSVRKCYFSDENPLKHFNRYSQTNCEIECIADFVLEKCGCTMLIYDDRGFEICGFDNRRCIKAVKAILFDRNLQQCNCLPACTSISFETEVYTAELNLSTSLGGHEFDLDAYEYNQIRIYFKEDSFLTSQRHEFYGATDFLAACGGLLGLFLGVSVISFLEIVYFCIIRLYMNLRVVERLDHVQVKLVEEFQRTHHVKKTKRCLMLLKKLLADYFTKTTIQGIKYVAKADLSLTERVWWAMVVALSTFSCGSLISNIIRQYEQSPVIISYANEETFISEIPYPAVTICPMVVFPQIQLMYDYFMVQNASLYDLPDDYIKSTVAAVQACDPSTYSHIDPENTTDCEGCSERLKWFLAGIDGLFAVCYHLSVGLTPCQEIFDVVVTEAGVCYTYNSLDIYRDQSTSDSNNEVVEEWTLEGGYRNSTEILSVYPRKATKYTLYLELIMSKAAKDNLCLGQIQGFKIFLHLPNETPQVSKHFYLAAYQRQTLILINPSMTITAPELRDLTIEKRQCYFSDERRLNFFRSYTQNNCEIECVVELILNICSCLMFYMPKIPGVKYCGISDIKCYQSVIQKSNERNVNQGQTSECNCLPTCTSITYSADINYVHYTEDDVIRDFYPDIIANYNTAHVDIIFRENQFVALKRSQRYGLTEFMAACGGLMGLFLGFSFMSVLEIIYFCVIRLVCDIRLKFLKHNP